MENAVNCGEREKLPSHSVEEREVKLFDFDVTTTTTARKRNCCKSQLGAGGRGVTWVNPYGVFEKLK